LVFRNSTGTYLSVTYTWPNISGSPSPASNLLTIAPSNALGLMFVYTGGGDRNFASYGGTFYWAVF
jgi:hypothetical protein